MTPMTLNEWLDTFDFGYEWTDEPGEDGDTGYRLIDYQGANLGNIEGERFDDPLNMVVRIADGIYWPDYVEADLEDNGYDGDYSLEDEYQFTLDHPEIYGDNGYELIYYAIHPEQLIVE